MHSDEMEDIQEAHAGQIVAVFGVDCASGDTFTDGSVRYTMTSMNVPEPVMSLAVSPVSKDSGGQFLKALNGFQKDYPTLHGQQTNKYYKKRLGVHATNQLLKEKQYSFSGKPLKVPIESSNDPIGEASCSLSPLGPRTSSKEEGLILSQSQGLDPESGQTIISGMGELHLDIYIEWIRTEYKVFLGLLTGLKPHAQKIEPTYISHHGANSKKRYVEPLAAGSPVNFEFKNMIVGQAIPSGFIPAIKKGFKEAANSGSLIGHPVENIRICLTDGVSHAVDSMLFCCKTCDTGAHHAGGTESSNRKEFQGNVAGDINKRKGVIVGSDQDGDDSVITAHVLLNNMSGYSTALHSMTQGTGEFTMEDKELLPISQDVQMQLVNSHKARKGTE